MLNLSLMKLYLCWTPVLKSNSSQVEWDGMNCYSKLRLERQEERMWHRSSVEKRQEERERSGVLNKGILWKGKTEVFGDKVSFTCQLVKIFLFLSYNGNVRLGTVKESHEWHTYVFIKITVLMFLYKIFGISNRNI